MREVNRTHARHRTALKAVSAITLGLLVSACTAQPPPPTPTATLQALATVTPVPTATSASPPTPTPVPPPPPTATETPLPTPAPTDTPLPPPPAPADTPTATAIPPLQVGEARVIYHDSEVIQGVTKYPTGTQPWLDLLIRSGEAWYGPERNADDVVAQPLPEGYRWEVEGSFATLPDGEAWWTGPGFEGQAKLIGPDGVEVYRLDLRVEFY